uniref:Major capsid protein n=1 Tax=Dulem virus 94 TaxID=3145805 RepID=A0AAU8B2T4_9VIRU
MVNRSVVYRAPKINKFPVKWTRDYTLDMGAVYPIMCEYAMPNSYWKFKPLHKLRTMPLVAPFMHDVYVSTRYFRVPLRLLMNEAVYHNYMTGGKNDDDATPTPVVNSGVSGYEAGSVMDYLGYVANSVDDNFQKVVVANHTENAWAIRAYWQVINDHFINTNITEPIEFSKEPGLDNTTPKEFFYASWGFDQYVNALPSLSRGDPVYLPLGTSAPINGSVAGLNNNGGGTVIQPFVVGKNFPTSGIIHGGAQGAAVQNKLDNQEIEGMYADLTGASAIDTNQLRDTVALGFAKNLSMYIGNRFQDWLYGVFGARASDARLQRAEYLGGQVSPLYVNDVDQTSATEEATTPQGNLAGKGIAFNGDLTIKCYCEEPCIILGVMYVLPKTTYYQGSRRWMIYNSRYDYPNPLYAKISDQPIYEEQLLAMGDDEEVDVTYTNDEGEEVTVKVNNKTKFGFEPRFFEATTIPSTVHGDLRSTLKYWTLTREFSKSAPPMLNESFVYAKNVSKRVFAVTDQKYASFIGHSLFRGYIKQPLPKNQLPSSMGLLFGEY